jgi:hypothetical protein
MLRRALHICEALCLFAKIESHKKRLGHFRVPLAHVHHFKKNEVHVDFSVAVSSNGDNMPNY